MKQKTFIITRNMLRRIIMDAYSNERLLSEGKWREDRLPISLMKDAERRLAKAQRARR